METVIVIFLTNETVLATFFRHVDNVVNTTRPLPVSENAKNKLIFSSIILKINHGGGYKLNN